MMRWSHVGMLAGALALVTGCHDHSEEVLPPTLEISVDPTTVQRGGQVTLTVTVDNFTLRDPDSVESTPMASPQHEDTGTTTAATSGHYHVYIDSLEENPLRMAWETEIDILLDVDAGEHEVFVRLNDDTHRIVEPQVVDSVMVTVTDDGSGGAGGAGGSGGAGGG